MADGDRKEERSGERSRTPAQARRASRRERVAQARNQKAPPKSQGGERAPRAGLAQFVRECAAELRKVRDYEQRNANRKGVLAALESKLS